MWSVVSDTRSKTAHANAVESTSPIGPPSPTIKLQVRAGEKSGYITCIPDTGADTTVMGKELLKTLKITRADLKHHSEFGINNPDGTKMSVKLLGSMYVDMTYGNKTIQGWINVLDSLPRPLLSWKHT